MVEVTSKAKSKWRPQALDTVVCSGGITPSPTSGFGDQGAVAGDDPVVLLLPGPHRKVLGENRNSKPWACLASVLFLHKLLVQYNCFTWGWRNKKRQISHPSPCHSCVITDKTLVLSLPVFMCLFFMELKLE